jgi:hypothetical protein
MCLEFWKAFDAAQQVMWFDLEIQVVATTLNERILEFACVTFVVIYFH